MDQEPIERVVSDEHHIVIRQFNKKDAKALWDLIDVNRDYLRRHREYATAEEIPFETFKETIVCPPDPALLRFGIWVENIVVGELGLEINDESKSAGVYYFIDEKHQGKRYTSLSLKRIVELAFEERRLSRIYANVNSENLGSKAVLFSAGFSEDNPDGENRVKLHYSRYRLPSDTLVKVTLFPCFFDKVDSGFGVHGYIVDKTYASGETFSYTDFLTFEQAVQRYGYLGTPEIRNDAEDICLNCHARLSETPLPIVKVNLKRKLLSGKYEKIREDMFRA